MNLDWFIVEDLSRKIFNWREQVTRNFWDGWFARVIIFQYKPSFTKLSKVYATNERRPSAILTSLYFPPTVRYFRSILSRDFVGRRKMGTGSEKTRGGNICRGTEPSSRRTWIYCIQTRRNRTRARPEGVADDSGGNARGWRVGRGRVRRLLYFLIIYHPS